MPLLTKRRSVKKRHKRFGECLDTYRLMDSVNDGTTLQILYKDKTADSALNEKAAFDDMFEDLFKDRSPEDMLTIKKMHAVPAEALATMANTSSASAQKPAVAS